MLVYVCIIFVGIDCYKLVNGEFVIIEITYNIYVDILFFLLKREVFKIGLDKLNMCRKFL